MALTCEKLGMYDVENILCEWDWEDGMDLGDGMTRSSFRFSPKAEISSTQPLAIEQRDYRIMRTDNLRLTHGTIYHNRFHRRHFGGDRCF